MDYAEIIKQVYEEVKAMEQQGAVATYIPEISCIDPQKFGIHITALDGTSFGIGDDQELFSIQSIAKVITLTMAFKLMDHQLWKRVGVEPSGNPFNSLLQLEHDQGIPRNPLINAGALVVCDVLISQLDNPKEELLTFVRSVAQNSEINFNDRIAASEKHVGFRNAALVNLMKSFGNIHNDVETVLDFYFCLCSIEMTCADLSRAFLYLANDGKEPASGQQMVSESKSKRINAIMQTCGFYDEAGDFSFRVGLPGKSGVGGGIMAILPESFCIAVWSPCLNVKGNSYKGLKFLEKFTTATGISIF